jgi:hypothetical protein
MKANSTREALGRCFRLLTAAVCAILLDGTERAHGGAPGPSITVVDMIPVALSGETDTNAEPDLTVSSVNPLEIAASVWVPEPLGGGTTPIFVSVDGGKTWSCRSTFPFQQETCDKTIRFGGLSDMLYVATLLNDDCALVVCRSDQLAKSLMSPAENKPIDVDQPFAAAAMINNKDRVFIGCLDFNGPPQRTDTVVRSLDGAGNPPSDFKPVPIEFDKPLIDSSEVRPAISADGNKVYAVFNRVISKNGNKRVGDVVLVRDDDGGDSGTASFTALKDQNGVAGFPVVKARTFFFDTDNFPALLGRDRLGGDLAIAIDPRKADRVYLVWGDVIEGHPALHVIRSDNGGTKWSGNLCTVKKAKNPGLAVTTNGTLGFLYQQVVKSEDGEETWITNLERTKDDFRSVDTKTLVRFPVAEIKLDNGQPQLGDYLRLMAAGNAFYGIFPASNVPDLSRFCCGVTFQRLHDSTHHKLLDQDGKEVDSSIDPFFVTAPGL